MARCAECAANIHKKADTYYYCPACGRYGEVLLCEQCGPGSVCPECGNPMEEEVN